MESEIKQSELMAVKYIRPLSCNVGAGKSPAQDFRLAFTSPSACSHVTLT